MTTGASPVPLTRHIAVWLRRGGTALLDLFFPPRCPGCGRVGDLFCSACRAQVEPIVEPVCRLCGRPMAQAALCPACRDRGSQLDGIVAAVLFTGPIREAIHSLKYANGRALAAPLAVYMAEAWRRAELCGDCLVPVPLHASRQAERGYNQSALLARVLAVTIGLPVNETWVTRRKATRQQALLNAIERRENVKDAFFCQAAAAGKRIVLIDDVCTTGSTLEACAAAVRAAGATSVWALTLARARWSPGRPAPDAR